MLRKYRKALPYVLIGLTLIIIGLSTHENLVAIGTGILSVGLMFVWQAESPAPVSAETER